MSGVILDSVRLLKGATVSGPLACGTNAATMGALSSSSISNSGTLSTGATTISGTMSCGTNAATCGALSSSSISNSGTLSTGATTISGTISCGTNSATCGALTASSVSAGPTASQVSIGVFTSKVNGVNRWTVGLSGTESTGDAGSDFMIHRYHDNGSAYDAPVTVMRSSGILVPSYGLKLPTSGGTEQTTLSFYQSGTVSVTWSGPWASTVSGNIYYGRIGNQVTLEVAQVFVTGNNTSSYFIASGLPSHIYPRGTLYFPILVRDSGASPEFSTGYLIVNSSGQMNVTKPSLAQFASTGTIGFYNIGVTYTVA